MSTLVAPIQHQIVSRQQPQHSRLEELTIRGREIGDRLELGLQNTIDNFYIESIPYGNEVLEQKPWNYKLYERFFYSDPNLSLRYFLRFAFSGEAYRTSYNQANVVWMCVVDNIEAEYVMGIGFNYLVKLSSTVSKIGRDLRRELIEAAKECRNIQEFHAMVDTALHGHHYEPKKTKLYTGSQSAISALNNYNEITKKAGDTRNEVEKIADVIAVSGSTDQEVADTNWYARATMTLCRRLRRQAEGLIGQSDTEILGKLHFDILEMSQDEEDIETTKEFAELLRTRPF